MSHPIHAEFPGRFVFVGFGSIGQGTLPLIMRHIRTTADRITIVAADGRGAEVAAHYGVKFITQRVTRDNLRSVLEPLVSEGDFVVNVSVEVSSIALLEWCFERGALYIDTCIEPWPGGYTDLNTPPERRTNYALRELALAFGADHAGGPTAVITHGANPGLVSHFVKQALVNIATDSGVSVTPPSRREHWAALAARLGVKVIHIAERDTQISPVRKQKDEFVNTWSVDGFVSEGMQPSELGWGTHERYFPEDGHRYSFGRQSSIYLNQPGAATRVRTWTPMAGPIHGFAITHGEAISLSDYLSVRDGEKVAYRPTVHYSYHPCDDAVLSVNEFVGKNYRLQSKQRILMDEISAGGVDELGVLLAGHVKNAYWYGSQLSIDETRQLIPFNNATSLQVTVSVYAGIIWAIENPRRGVVEPEEIDFARILELSKPYLGPVIGAYTDWTPLMDRERLMPEDIARDDPWQFKNIRVR